MGEMLQEHEVIGLAWEYLRERFSKTLKYEIRGVIFSDGKDYMSHFFEGRATWSVTFRWYDEYESGFEVIRLYVDDFTREVWDFRGYIKSQTSWRSNENGCKGTKRKGNVKEK